MNILVLLFGSFPLLVIASFSFTSKESKSRGIQAPFLWKRSNIDTSDNPGRNRKVSENDRYNQAISDYEQFRLTHGVPGISDSSRDKLHNTSEMRDDIPATFPHQNPGGFTSVESFVSGIKPYLFPGQKEEADTKFNSLLCLADCRMAELMVFNMRNQIGNNSFPFRHIPLAGRPYTFASLNEWCKENCGKRTAWTKPDLKQDHLNVPANPFEDLGTGAKRPTQSENEKAAVSDAEIPFISFGGKAPGLLPPIAPVIPTIFFPPVRNFFPYRNIITAPFIHRQSNQDARFRNADKIPGVAFRSLKENSPRSFPPREYYSNQIHQQPRPKERVHPTLAEYNAFRDSRKFQSDLEKREQDLEYRQTDGFTDKIGKKTRYDEDDEDYEGRGDYEDIYEGDDYSDDDTEHEKIDSVVRFLREVSKILSNKAFRVLLKRVSSCDTKRNSFARKEHNNTDLHSRGLH